MKLDLKQTRMSTINSIPHFWRIKTFVLQTRFKIAVIHQTKSDPNPGLTVAAQNRNLDLCPRTQKSATTSLQVI